MNSELVQHYIQNPIYSSPLDVFSLYQNEGNSICGDEISVYIQLENDDTVLSMGFDGSKSSMITAAAASFLGDLIKWVRIHEILNWNYQTLASYDFVVSTRRKRAAVLALLAVRNAIHSFMKDGKRDSIDDLIEE